MPCLPFVCQVHRTPVSKPCNVNLALEALDSAVHGKVGSVHLGHRDWFGIFEGRTDLMYRAVVVITLVGLKNITVGIRFIW